MNPRLFMLALGVGVGYVLGTRAGRERYDAMKAQVLKVWDDPRVVKARTDVEDYAKQQAPIIRERAEAAAKAAPGVIADTAKDVADKVTSTAKDVRDQAVSVAKDVRDQATTVAKDVRDQAGKVAADLRERGEAFVDSAVAQAGEARDRVLDTIDDEDDAPNR